MNVERLLLISSLVSLIACTNVIADPAIEQPIAGSGGAGATYQSHPSVVAASASSGEQSDFWECGKDYVITEGPDDEIIIVEVRIPCDPIADIYMGCPAPVSEQ